MQHKSEERKYISTVLKIPRLFILHSNTEKLLTNCLTSTFFFILNVTLICENFERTFQNSKLKLIRFICILKSQ